MEFRYRSPSRPVGGWTFSVTCGTENNQRECDLSDKGCLAFDTDQYSAPIDAYPVPMNEQLTPEEYEALAAQCIVAMREFDAPDTIRSLACKAQQFSHKAAELRAKSKGRTLK